MLDSLCFGLFRLYVYDYDLRLAMLDIRECALLSVYSLELRS